MTVHACTVRTGFMRSLGEVVVDGEGASSDGEGAATPSLRRGDWVVVETERGTEIGDVLAGPAPVARERAPSGQGRFVRKATAEDLARRRAIEDDEAIREFKTCRRLAAELGLPMKVVSVEHLFGGERLIFYFTSEGRVDFRGLVRELARAFRTRIEMRQIGARDEARLLGDVGHCGRELCCRTFLRELEPVTMRMARSQKATLDPSKISGACGRLMCCLRYEDETYRELKDGLPPLGAVHRLKAGLGEVIGHEILARRAVLLLESGRRVEVRAEELTAETFVEQREPRPGPFDLQRDPGHRDDRRGRRSGRWRDLDDEDDEPRAPAAGDSEPLPRAEAAGGGGDEDEAAAGDDEDPAPDEEGP